MDVYLDNIVIYLDTAEDHIWHVKLVINTLCQKKFYLSEHKLKFFVNSLKILGHVINSSGITMDPDKVDKVLSWKTPAIKEAIA